MDKLCPYLNKQSAMKKITTIILLFLFISCHGQTAAKLNSQGFRQAKKGNYSRAIELFTQAIKANEFFTDAYYNRALAYSRLKQYEQAISDYTKAIEIRPHFKMAYNNRGADRNELKDFKGAIEDYTKAIQLAIITVVLR
jgi:tetratricopeptide (TPR) repeat protein